MLLVQQVAQIHSSMCGVGCVRVCVCVTEGLCAAALKQNCMQQGVCIQAGDVKSGAGFRFLLVYNTLSVLPSHYSLVCPLVERVRRSSSAALRPKERGFMESDAAHKYCLHL